MWYAIVAILILIADQGLKYWVTLNIPLDTGHVTLIPGVLELTNIHNNGAAFSILQHAPHWIFVIFTVVFAAIAVFCLRRNIVHGKVGRWSVVLVLAGAVGNCIDRILSGYVVDMRSLPELTRSAAQRLLAQGAVTKDGAPVKKNYKTAPGDTFVVTLPDAAPSELVAQDLPLDVVYEDDDLIVVNKPRGMVVHPAPGHEDGTLVNALLAHCGDSLSGVGGERRPGIVHRIDKDTSGLLVAAKNDFAHLALSAQLADHTMARTYEAVVCGNLREDSGTVDAPIGRHPTDRKRMAVTQKNARRAVTHWSVIARYNGYTHIRCELETGRTHQIRVHMAHIGHPLLGDLVYGHKRPEKGLSGQCLHARALRFLHPRTGELVTFSCPLPDYFQDVLARLGPPVG